MTSLKISTWRRSESRRHTLRHGIVLQTEIKRSTTRGPWSFLRLSRHWRRASDRERRRWWRVYDGVTEHTSGRRVRIRRRRGLSVESSVESASNETTVRRRPVLLTEVRAAATLSFRQCLIWNILRWIELTRVHLTSCEWVKNARNMSSFVHIHVIVRKMFIWVYQSVSKRLHFVSKHIYDQTHLH